MTNSNLKSTDLKDIDLKSTEKVDCGSTNSISKNNQAYMANLGLTFKSNNLPFLRDLQSAHVTKYSFNSIGVLLGHEIKIDTQSVFEKIVEQGLGGYCFEHNKLSYDLLVDLGFKAKIVLAKVVGSDDIEAPKTHRISIVTLAGLDYIVDTGFGHLGAIYPVSLELNTVQNQGQFSYRVKKNSIGEFCFEILKEDSFVMLYKFNLHHFTETDCKLSNFYSYKHPETAFVNNFVLSTKQQNNIKSLRNSDIHYIKNDKITVEKVTSLAQLNRLIKQTFSLDITDQEIEFLYNKFVSGK